MVAKKKVAKKRVAKKQVTKKKVAKRSASKVAKSAGAKKKAPKKALKAKPTSGKKIIGKTRTRITRKEALKELGRKAQKIKKEDVGRVIRKSRDLEARFVEQGPLQKFLAILHLLMSLLKDYKAGRYRQVPWWVIAAVTAALLYVLTPIDLIPDFIPIFGYVDDGSVVAACLALCGKELKAYERWRDAQ